MAFLDTFKAVVVPAIIAAALYALIAFAIVPLIKHHRERYSQYLPVNSFSRGTTSIRDRITDTLTAWIVPRRHLVHDASGDGDEFVFAEEDGDQMFGFDVERSDRRVRGGDVA